MIGRQHTWAAALGIRVAGLVCLTLAWFVGGHLYHQVHAHALRSASLRELASCGLLLVSVLLGNVLSMVGPGLWQDVELPGRHPYGASEAQQLERLMDGAAKTIAEKSRAKSHLHRGPAARSVFCELLPRLMG